MTQMDTYETVGVVAPTPEGRWRAAHGLGSYTREVGMYPTEQAAREAAGADGRRVVLAQPGESGWDAYARAGRERVAADLGIRVDWMHTGDVIGVRLDPVHLRVLRSPGGVSLGVLYELGEQPSARDAHQARVELATLGLLAAHLPTPVTGTAMLAGLATRAGQSIAEMLDGHPSNAWSVTPMGATVLGAVAAGHAERALLLCAAQSGGQWLPDHSARCWCTGQTYLGDQETDPTRSKLTLVDPVGLVEISQRCGVSRGQVDMWRYDRPGRPESSFPPPDAIVGGRPAWSWATIRDWLNRTGRA